MFPLPTPGPIIGEQQPGIVEGVVQSHFLPRPESQFLPVPWAHQLLRWWSLFLILLSLC